MKYLILISLGVAVLFLGCGGGGGSSSGNDDVDFIPTSSSKSISIMSSSSNRIIYPVSSYTKNSSAIINKDAAKMPQIPTASNTVPTADLKDSTN